MKKSRKEKKLRRSLVSRSRDDGPKFGRWLETLALLLALVLVGGIIGYVALAAEPGIPVPPGREADGLEGPPRLEPGPRRVPRPARTPVPQNPAQEDDPRLRDRILLEDVKGRARMLQSQANTPLNRPQNEIEAKFAEYYTLVAAAESRNDLPAAIQVWKDLARQYREDDPEERPWHLLARSRAKELLEAVERRRESVQNLKAQALHAELSGDHASAASIRAEILKKYSRYADVADLLEDLRPPSLPDATPTGEPPPAKSPAAPMPEPSSTTPATPEPASSPDGP